MRTMSLNRMLSIAPNAKMDPPPGSPMKRGPKSIFGPGDSQDSSLGRGIRCLPSLGLMKYMDDNTTLLPGKRLKRQEPSVRFRAGDSQDSSLGIRCLSVSDLSA